MHLVEALIEAATGTQIHNCSQNGRTGRFCQERPQARAPPAVVSVLLMYISWGEETHSERIQRQDFIEDGKLVHTTKRAEINNEGKMELVFDLSVSFTVDKQGNVIREAIYSLPNKNIKIIIVMWTLRCLCEGQTEFNQ